jgi:hypothetical protein
MTDIKSRMTKKAVLWKEAHSLHLIFSRIWRTTKL